MATSPFAASGGEGFRPPTAVSASASLRSRSPSPAPLYRLRATSPSITISPSPRKTSMAAEAERHAGTLGPGAYRPEAADVAVHSASPAYTMRARTSIGAFRPAGGHDDADGRISPTPSRPDEPMPLSMGGRAVLSTTPSSPRHALRFRVGDSVLVERSRMGVPGPAAYGAPPGISPPVRPSFTDCEGGGGGGGGLGCWCAVCAQTGPADPPHPSMRRRRGRCHPWVVARRATDRPCLTTSRQAQRPTRTTCSTASGEAVDVQVSGWGYGRLP